jgi:hypothetical protein
MAGLPGADYVAASERNVMNYWSREVAGWLFIILGLFVFYRSYTLLSNEGHYIIEGGALTIVGVFLFRGGIQLLKIAVAARICLQADERLESRQALPSAKNAPVRTTVPPVAGRRL